MFAKKQALTLFSYHWDTTEKLLAQAKELDSADYHAHPGYGHGSIHDLFLHILVANASWRTGLITGQQSSPINRDTFTDLASIKTGFAAEKAAWDDYFATISSADIEGTIDLTNWRGDIIQFPLWGILQHLALHGMQHHTEIAQLLTAHDQSPGDIDMIFYFIRGGSG
jgi:uncharacterized damage-inducible protein DinB